MAFDAAHGLTFIPVIEAGNVIVETIDRPAGLVEGQFTTPSFVPEAYDPVAMRSLYGPLPMMAAPITYRVNGVQYLAIMAGYGGGGVITGTPLDPASAAYRYGNDGRIIALKLGGPVPPLPPLRADDGPPPEPPARQGTAAEITRGEVLYNRHCSRCHVYGRGILPDLRRATPATHTLFKSIVLEGIYAPKGMARFDDVLSAADAEALHDYVIDQAWQLKDASASASPPAAVTTKP